MELIGNGTPEKGERLRMECLQRSRYQTGWDLSRHIQVLIEDEFHFLILLATPLYEAWTGVDFYPAATADIQFAVYRVAKRGAFCHILQCQQS